MQSRDAQNFSERDNELDIADIGRTIARQWLKICAITILTTAIALYSVLMSYPIFLINGSLYLGDAQSGSSSDSGASGAISFLSDFQSVSDVETQIRLLQANALLEQAISESGLNASILPEGSSTMRFWKWRFSFGESMDALAPQPGDLEVRYASLLDQGSRGARFNVVFDTGGHYRLLTGGGWFSRPSEVLEGNLNQPAAGAGIAFMIKSVSPGAAPPAGSEYVLTVNPVRSVAAVLLSGPLSISSSGTGSTPTKLADIQFEWNNPFQGQLFVDQLMRDFIATQLSWKTEAASATEDFVSGQLQKVNNSLTQADQTLAAYQSKTGIVDVPANAQAVISQLSQYEVSRTTVLLQEEALQQLEKVTANPTGDINPYLVSQVGDPQLGDLSTALANAEVTLQGQRTQFTGNTSEVQIESASIAKLKEAIRTIIRNDESLAAANLANLDSLIAKYEAQLKTMPAEALQVIALTRSSDVFGQLYVLLMQKEEEAEVSKAATIVDTRVVTPAEIPLRAAKPNARLTVLTGILLGLFAGIGIVLAQRAISGRFQSEEEARRAISLPIYGQIPKRPRADAAGSIFSDRRQSPFSEAFRLLRSNLYQSTSGLQSRVILITSPGSGDGKTTTSANLAKTLADDGKRVLLVDADLHRGRVHEVLRLNQAPGLTDWLVTSERPPLQAVAGQRFLVLSGGMFPPNPSEILNEPMAAKIITTLREEFDYIILDCPPLPTVSDTMSLAVYGDLILSVVYIAKTLRKAFIAHNETIATTDLRHGLIINGVIGSFYGYGHGYDYGYGYRSDDEHGAPNTWSTQTRKIFGRVFRIFSR